MNGTWRSLLAGLAITVLALGLIGCFNPFNPRIATSIGVTEPQPSPNSPTGIIELFQWCYRHRDYNVYSELFTDDYIFTFNALDPAGDPYRGTPWGREQELASAKGLFVTGANGEEAATSISLDFNNQLLPIPDQRERFQKSDPAGRWHKQLTVSVLLDVKRPSSALQVKGEATFFVVRADSAFIPKELNIKPDTLRWFIQGWLDNTVATSPAMRARPAGSDAAAAAWSTPPRAAVWPPPTYSVTFGVVKRAYLPTP